MVFSVPVLNDGPVWYLFQRKIDKITHIQA